VRGTTRLACVSARWQVPAGGSRAIFFKVDKSHFGALVKLAPQVERSILLHTKERLLMLYRSLSVPFFAELVSEDKIQVQPARPPVVAATASRVRARALACELAHALGTRAHRQYAATHAVLEHYDEGASICTKDSEGSAFYVVVSGEVNVLGVHGEGEGDGDTTVVTLRSGRYFGELSMMLAHQKVTATCVAATRTTLLELPRDGTSLRESTRWPLAAVLRHRWRFSVALGSTAVSAPCLFLWACAVWPGIYGCGTADGCCS
jgi:hypothetical protein